MSRDLEKFLTPEHEIPWGEAAVHFVAMKEATLIKEAAVTVTKEDLAKAQARGMLSGVRSSVHQDLAQVGRARRTRGARAGRELGTLGGAAAGFAAGRKGGIAGKIGGTAIGALMGRSAGKTLGEEADRKRTIARYKAKQKKAEIEKRGEGDFPGVSKVRALWKLAQGELPTEAHEGPDGVEGAFGQADVGEMTPMGPHVVPPSGAPSPEDVARAEAMARLEQEMMADEMAEQSAADYYKQLADEASGQLEQAQAAIQESQAAAEQAGQQAQMSQQQADMATQQLQQQSQQDSMEKQQLNEEALSAKQNIMQMRQAMQAYRENLQQLALQDPTAQAGPSPEEQGMPGAEGEGAQPMSGQAAKQMQEAQQAEQEAQMQGAQAEQAAAEDQAKMEEAAAMEQEAVAQQEAAMEQQAAMGKQSSAIPELLKEGMGPRGTGALVGAMAGAGLQALSDRRGPGGKSEKERVLQAKLDHLQQKKDPTAFDKHMITMTRALADTAKTNREHPGSAAAMAAITGAIAGAALGPTISRMRGRFMR